MQFDPTSGTKCEVYSSLKGILFEISVSKASWPGLSFEPTFEVFGGRTRYVELPLSST